METELFTPSAPPLSFTRCRIPKGEIIVVREDLLPGGTKQRGAIPYVRELARQGYRELVYASPFCGYAQIALAIAARAAGVKLRLFCEADPSGSFGELSIRARELGAELVLSPTLATAETWAEADLGHKIPLGLQTPAFLEHYRRSLARELPRLRQNGKLPRRMWLPVGSGTLAGIFRELLPSDIQLACVNVRVLDTRDPRLLKVRRLTNTRVFDADEQFREPSKGEPPVPSNLFYDAKLWSFIVRHGEDGDVWWNVAR